MNKKKFFVSMLITVLVVATIALGLWVAKLFFGNTLAEKFGEDLSNRIIGTLDKQTDDKVNILLLGLDKDRTRADVIMVVSVDPNRNRVDILSIPRDTRVQHSPNHFDKINHSMGYKNPEETTIKMVKQITGMPIHYYCEVDFAGFRNVIDILGGVEFNVPVDMHYEDPEQDLYIHVNKGWQVLDGKNAEGVVRFRATYPGGDNDRIPVQQDFIHALFEQKLKPQYIVKAPSIISEIYNNVTTNFSVAKATGYIPMLKNLNKDSLKTHTLPGEGQYIGNVSYFVYDKEATKKLISEEFGYSQ
ncbi:MAG: LCP family protein [Clostridia bacterium]|nr:LCP family protein [Clostridia bacterium]